MITRIFILIGAVQNVKGIKVPLEKAFSLEIAQQTKGTNINIILHCLHMLATASKIYVLFLRWNGCVECTEFNRQKYISINTLQV